MGTCETYIGGTLCRGVHQTVFPQPSVQPIWHDPGIWTHPQNHPGHEGAVLGGRVIVGHRHAREVFSGFGAERPPRLHADANAVVKVDPVVDEADAHLFLQRSRQVFEFRMVGVKIADALGETVHDLEPFVSVSVFAALLPRSICRLLLAGIFAGILRTAGSHLQRLRRVHHYLAPSLLAGPLSLRLIFGWDRILEHLRKLVEFLFRPTRGLKVLYR